MGLDRVGDHAQLLGAIGAHHDIFQVQGINDGLAGLHGRGGLGVGVDLHVADAGVVVGVDVVDAFVLKAGERLGVADGEDGELLVAEGDLLRAGSALPL